MKLERFFGDGEHTFALTDDMVRELERKTDTGIGALYIRVVKMEFRLHDMLEIIRLGLIGGGKPPQEAAQLVRTYAENRPFNEFYPLALDILDARWGDAEPVDQEAAA